jgi:hypothetical protein
MEVDMTKFDDFKVALEDGIKDLAKKTTQDFAEQALDDGKAFVKETEDDLKRWTKLLASGDLTEDDFKFLVQSKKDVAEMVGLKQKGLALAKIDSFRRGVLNLVVSTAIDVFLA